MAQINKPTDYFNTKLYTGNSSTQSITGVGFQPDWVWCKSRSGADNHAIFDAVRGGQKQLRSNTTDAELTRTNAISSFDSDGWSMGSQPEMNSSGTTYASWNWLAGGTASSNTDGATTTNVSVNTTAGFSVFTFTGTGANTTVGHGLGAVPKMFIVKRYDASNNWRVYHHSLGNGNQLTLEQTSASASAAGFTNNTDPTSSVISLGNQGSSNASGGSMICYAFAEKKGFSKFGKYTSINSHDSNFVYLGFKPAMIIFKNISVATDWHILDRTRYSFNGSSEAVLEPNTSDAENYSAFGEVDFLSNGFKIRNNNGVSSGGYEHIYMAFAESPLVGTNNIPAVAR